MKWLLSLLACVMPCMAQLTLENAHYPTIFRSASGASVPPVSGYVLWLAPEGDVYADVNGVTNGVSLGPIRRWNDLSGYSNHVYKITSTTVAGANFDSAYTLNGKRIMQFGRNTNDISSNKTGLATSNNITLIGGFTLFWVGSWLPSPSIGEVGQAWFGYNNFELLARGALVNPDPITRTYHNSGGLELVDPVSMGQSNYQFYTWTFNDSANTSALYRSNSIVASATDNGSTPAAGKASIGYRFDDTVNGHLNGGITEMILYTNALTTTQISNVNVYLKNKYGL